MNEMPTRDEIVDILTEMNESEPRTVFTGNSWDPRPTEQQLLRALAIVTVIQSGRQVIPTYRQAIPLRQGMPWVSQEESRATNNYRNAIRMFHKYPLAGAGVLAEEDEVAMLLRRGERGGQALVWIKETCGIELPPTLSTISGFGDVFMLWKCKNINIESRFALTPGLTVLGKSEIIPIPPNTSENGIEYRWLPSPLFPWIGIAFGYSTEPKMERKNTQGSRNQETDESLMNVFLKSILDYKKPILNPSVERIPQELFFTLEARCREKKPQPMTTDSYIPIQSYCGKNREIFLTSISKSLVRDIDPRHAHSLIQELNRTQCVPPLTESETTKIVEDACQLELNRIGVKI